MNDNLSILAVLEEDLAHVLKEDLTQIEDTLSSSNSYSFCDDLMGLMESQNLSSSALARRINVSHTIVDNWRKGKARPKGKERYKELGMALGMNTEALNRFLLMNGYPRLYVKNPLDSAARYLLDKSAGEPDIVETYHILIQRLHLNRLTTEYDEEPLESTVMSKDFKKAAEDGHVSLWFKKFRHQFVGSDKKDLPDIRLGRFLLLYLGDQNVYELAVEGDLPPALQNLLYPILAGKKVVVKHLREKIIAFGLYSNMTEEEINIMLRLARLQLLSEPATALDLAVREALSLAHDRYPYYERDNLERLMRRLDPPKDEFEKQLLSIYTSRNEIVEQMVSYFNQHPKSPEDRAFEENYTSYADRCIMDYVHDILVLLIKKGFLNPAESKVLLKLITRNEKGDSIWN